MKKINESYRLKNFLNNTSIAIKNMLLIPLYFFPFLKSVISYHLRKYNIIHTYGYLAKYKNIHEGDRAFFVGTGPSLTIQDVNKLQGEIVFGVNSLVDSIAEIEIPIRYYCLADKRAVDLFYRKASKANMDAVFVGSGRINKREVQSKNTEIFPDTRRYLMFRHLFGMKDNIEVSTDITNIVYDGGSVIFSAMQIAAYMGIKEMYLLGVDCNYAPGIANFNEFRGEREIKVGGNERLQLEGFIKFKEYAEARGIHVYNATRGGKLELFPRKNLDDVVKVK